MTRVVAINGSPMMEKGRTDKILKPFLEGLKEGGATVELFYATRLDIKPCAGELICWNERPGECYILDDMQALYPKLRKADILVLATPVYIPFPGEMQNFVNRLVPLMDPELEWKGGRTRARLHPGVKITKFVLVSSSGWWEMGNFGTVIRIVKELAKDCGVEFAGALLRPHSDMLAERPEKAMEVYKAARQAGYELAKNGKIPPSLTRAVGKPLAPRSP